jgi:hypothetical protein
MKKILYSAFAVKLRGKQPAMAEKIPAVFFNKNSTSFTRTSAIFLSSIWDSVILFFAPRMVLK